MGKEKGKILRVTIEYENIKYIAEGKDAEDWRKRVSSAEGLLLSQSWANSPFKWTNEVEELFEEKDPQAEIFGWFLKHGWLPPNEVALAEKKVRGDLLQEIERVTWHRDIEIGMGKHKRFCHCHCIAYDDWQALE